MAKFKKIVKYRKIIEEMQRAGYASPAAVLILLLKRYADINETSLLLKLSALSHRRNFKQQVAQQLQQALPTDITLPRFIMAFDDVLLASKKMNKEGDLFALWVAFFSFYPYTANFYDKRIHLDRAVNEEMPDEKPLSILKNCWITGQLAAEKVIQDEFDLILQEMQLNESFQLTRSSDFWRDLYVIAPKLSTRQCSWWLEKMVEFPHIEKLPLEAMQVLGVISKKIPDHPLIVRQLMPMLARSPLSCFALPYLDGLKKEDANVICDRFFEWLANSSFSSKYDLSQVEGFYVFMFDISLSLRDLIKNIQPAYQDYFMLQLSNTMVGGHEHIEQYIARAYCLSEQELSANEKKRVVEAIHQCRAITHYREHEIFLDLVLSRLLNAPSLIPTISQVDFTDVCLGWRGQMVNRQFFLMSIFPHLSLDKQKELISSQQDNSTFIALLPDLTRSVMMNDMLRKITSAHLTDAESIERNLDCFEYFMQLQDTLGGMNNATTKIIKKHIDKLIEHCSFHHTPNSMQRLSCLLAYADSSQYASVIEKVKEYVGDKNVVSANIFVSTVRALKKRGINNESQQRIAYARIQELIQIFKPNAADRIVALAAMMSLTEQSQAISYARLALNQAGIARQVIDGMLLLSSKK